MFQTLQIKHFAQFATHSLSRVYKDANVIKP